MTDKTYDIIIGVIASRSAIYDGLVECYWKPFINFVNKTNNKKWDLQEKMEYRNLYQRIG